MSGLHLNVLDPGLPWVYLLYLLAGAGVTVVVLPGILSQLAPADRETLTQMPVFRAFVWAVCIASWPVPLLGMALHLGRWKR